jgi:hypothetical protein
VSAAPRASGLSPASRSMALLPPLKLEGSLGTELQQEKEQEQSLNVVRHEKLRSHGGPPKHKL